jgi:hypothetical protein
MDDGPSIRVEQVEAQVTVTDAQSYLSPQMLERIVRAVLARLAEAQRDERTRERERQLGDQR